MKELIKQYLDHDVSRRGFLTALGGLGLTASAADAMASSLEPFVMQEPSAAGGSTSREGLREVRGTGGALLVAQLKAAGIRHLFCSPSAAVGPFFDALVDEPEMHVIKVLEEGAAGAMADGYAKASGKPAFAMVDAAGMPAFMGQMYVSWADHMPVVLAVDDDQIPNATNSITKWQWIAERAERIPAVTRQALKFATTHPSGPVFLVLSGETLRDEAQTTIFDQERFAAPLTIRPDPSQVERAARLLLEARNPLLYAGGRDHGVQCGTGTPRARRAAGHHRNRPRSGEHVVQAFPAATPAVRGSSPPDDGLSWGERCHAQPRRALSCSGSDERAHQADRGPFGA